jgi:TatD DNase family protein
MQIRFIDAHLHLQDPRFGTVVRRLIERAETSGVCRFFCNAVSESDWPAVAELAAGNSWIIPFLGIHPWFAAEAAEGWQERLIALLSSFTHGAGIGETGLDKSRPVDFKAQQKLLQAHLEIAAETGLPLSMHCVKAWGPLLDILQRFRAEGPRPPVMIHSYNGSVETMRRLVDLGCFLSYSSALIDPGNNTLRETFCQTPAAALLLETDAPYSKFADPASGNTIIEPEAITDLYYVAAELRTMHLADFSSLIWNNASIFAHRAFTR